MFDNLDNFKLAIPQKLYYKLANIAIIYKFIREIYASNFLFILIVQNSCYLIMLFCKCETAKAIKYLKGDNKHEILNDK